MVDGQAPNGTGALLTVDDAASAFEALLSDESEDKQKPEAPAPESPTEEVAEDDDEAQDESDDTEPTDESDDESSEDTEESDEEDTPPTKVHRLKVDGEEIEVTEEELLKGYSRTADYTRKTQALAAEKQQFEAERTAVREERQRYTESLAQLNEALKAQDPEEPDWDTLRREDPAEYAATWALWQQYQQRKADVAAEMSREQQKLAQDQMEQLKVHLSQEREKLVEAIPAWKDKDVAAREKKELAEFAKAAGYTDEELSQVYDHRVMVLLRKAMLYDKAQKAKPSVQKKIERVKVASPGSAATTRPKNTEVAKAKQRLAKSGSVQDAAALFEQMIDD